MIRLAIARTVDAEVRSMQVHRMRRVAGIDPSPAHRLVRGVSKALGVRPGFTIDHGNLVGRCFSKVGSAPPQGNHKNPVGGRTASRVDDERPSELTVFAKRSAMVATCQIAACARIVFISAGCACGKSPFSRFVRCQFVDRLFVSRMRVETMQHCLNGQQVADGQMDRDALRYSNQWAGNLKRSALLRECVDLHARTRFGLRVPVSLPQFEVERQNSVL